MEPAEHLAVLERSAGRLVGAATGGLDRPVPSCPGWHVADLVAHIGRTWGWSATIVETGERAERPEPPGDLDEGSLLRWAEGHLARLLAALRDADPESGCWTFGMPRTRRFWFRRQALETALHAWDVERASDAAEPIPGEVAADGVDEYLTVMVPRWMENHPDHSWRGETFHLHRTDGDGEWLVRLGPGRTAAVEAAHGKGDVAVRGTGEDLWLWCTNRRRSDGLAVDVLGDFALATRWSAEITF